MFGGYMKSFYQDMLKTPGICFMRVPHFFKTFKHFPSHKKITSNTARVFLKFSAGYYLFWID